MLEKIWGFLEIFILPRKIIKRLIFFHFCPKKLGTLKTPHAQKFWALAPCNKVQEIFHLCPNILGIMENS
jgi:hypothetical protein